MDKNVLAKAMEATTTLKVERYEPNYDGFVVIGAGLPRTGTLSMQAALSKLLNGPCYHMVWVFEGADESDHWESVIKGKASKKDWIDFLAGRGFRAGVDYPISHHFE